MTGLSDSNNNEETKMNIKVMVTIAVMAFACVATAQDYDIVILNGRVMDPETKFDAVRNVGIQGERIVTIMAESITGKKTIDVTDHAIAPGFINTHSHSFGAFDQKMMAHDGTTTILDTEGEIKLDFGDKPFQWHADLEGSPEHTEFPNRPVRLGENIPGSPDLKEDK